MDCNDSEASGDLDLDNNDNNDVRGNDDATNTNGHGTDDEFSDSCKILTVTIMETNNLSSYICILAVSNCRYHVIG